MLIYILSLIHMLYVSGVLRNVAAMPSVGTVPRGLEVCVLVARRQSRPLRRPPWAMFISVPMEEEGERERECVSVCC